MSQFIRVVNWKRFQHYKDRNPPWIKLHRELLTSQTWVALNDASRVLAIACMLLAAATDNRIPMDSAYIRRVAYLNQEPDLSDLLSTHFIEIVDEAGCASPVLADASNLHSNARPETETETEKRREEKAGSAVAPSTAKAKRASQMPEDFQPKDSHRALAAEHGVNLEAAFAAFSDHHASKGNKFVDWDKAFNNWLRREQAFARRNGRNHAAASQSQPSDFDPVKYTLEQLGMKEDDTTWPNGLPRSI